MLQTTIEPRGRPRAGVRTASSWPPEVAGVRACGSCQVSLPACGPGQAPQPARMLSDVASEPPLPPAGPCRWPVLLRHRLLRVPHQPPRPSDAERRLWSFSSADLSARGASWAPPLWQMALETAAPKPKRLVRPVCASSARSEPYRASSCFSAARSASDAPTCAIAPSPTAGPARRRLQSSGRRDVVVDAAVGAPSCSRIRDASNLRLGLRSGPRRLPSPSSSSSPLFSFFLLSLCAFRTGRWHLELPEVSQWSFVK